MQAYLQLLNEDELPYHDYLLPVAQQRLQRLLLQSQYQVFASFIYQLDIIEHMQEKKQRIEQLQRKEVLNKKKDTTQFLKERKDAKNKAD
jgi:hypothetical protein